MPDRCCVPRLRPHLCLPPMSGSRPFYKIPRKPCPFLEPYIAVPPAFAGCRTAWSVSTGMPMNLLQKRCPTAFSVHLEKEQLHRPQSRRQNVVKQATKTRPHSD